MKQPGEWEGLTDTTDNDFGDFITKGQGFADGMDIGDVSHDDLERCRFLETVLSEHGLQLSRVADKYAAVLALCQRATEGGEAAAYDSKVSCQL
jgi:hypothetical protein